MRGADQNQDGMFSYLSPAARVPKDHPLRPIKKMVNQALSELWHDFEAMYAKEGALPPLRRSCCAPCCCKRCTPSAVNDC